MESLAMLHADPLDILFENRNKAYGAYPLRKFYHQRLLISTGVMLSTVVLFATLIWLKRNDPPVTMIYTDREITLSSIPVEPFIKPRLPVAGARHTVPAATAAVTPPLIVRDETIKTPVPDIADLDGKQIGPVNQAGVITDVVSGPTTGGSGTGASPEKESQAASGTEILSSADVMPAFPGGAEALKRFLLKHLNMPAGEAEPGTVIRVLARFVVNRDGEVSGLEVSQSGGKDYDREVLRVIKMMPRWKPGIQHGSPVNVYFILPVSFSVTE